MTAVELEAASRSAVRSAIDGSVRSVEGLLAHLDTTPSREPFDETALAFCEALSRELLASRADPAVVALGYWLRPAAVDQMRRQVLAARPDREIVVPRGLVFHVTPANVETIFVYSWVLALLAGNANVVRLSSRATPTRERLLDAIRSSLARPATASLVTSNAIILTDHDDAVIEALIGAADVRVVWGGDATIERFRRLPLRPDAREVVFPDRHSLALIDADAVLAMPPEDLRRAGDAFFNDAYAFDQGACSSPRLVMWRARTAETRVAEARHRFHESVEAAIERRGYTAPTGIAITKLALALERAASSDGARIEHETNEATWVLLPSLDAYDRGSCGGGLFFEIVSTDLATDLGRFIRGRDQTATCLGIDEADIRSLARALRGRGLDRFVRLGRALDFDSTWDGMDLFTELTKRVVIDV